MSIYEKLENYVKKYVETVGATIPDEYILIKKLNDIIFYDDYRYYNLKPTRKYRFNKVDKLVEDFLSQINSYYKDYYQLRKKDGTIFFDNNCEKDAYAFSDYDFENKKRIMYIPVSKFIYDFYSIIHELFHDINLDETDQSLTRAIFTESLSLLGEFLMEDYLKNKKIKDVKVNNNLNLYYIKNKSIEVDFNLQLIMNYLDYGYLNENIIDNIVNSYPELYMSYLEVVISKMKKENGLTLDLEQGYIIGILFATYMYDRIKGNKKNIKELFELNEMIKEFTFEQVLDYLDLDYNDIDLTDESYKKLEKTYRKYLKSR